MSVFEVLMLLCFGAAWPISVYKSWVSKTNGGKSVIFLCIVLAGYVSGVLHKIFNSPDSVILLYVFNGLMVFADIMVYYRNKYIIQTS